MKESKRPILEEGLVTGLVGAGLVAVWFFVLDCVRGDPFFTPTLLGSVLFDGTPVDQVSVVSTKMVFAYSGLHVILFLLVGCGLTLMFREFEANPHFGIVYLLIYVMFEVIIFGVEVSWVPEVLGVIGTWAVAVGNGLSAVGMFLFLLRRYPDSMTRMVSAWHEEAH